MNFFNHNIKNILSRFVVPALLFIICGCLLSSVEFLYLKSSNDSFAILILAYARVFCLFSLYSLALFPFYLLVVLWSERAARIVLCTVFSFLVILECTLLIYNWQTGSLLGSELFLRPFSEIWLTLQSSSNILFDTLLIIGIIAVFTIIPALLRKFHFFKHRIFVCATFFVIIVAALANFVFPSKNPIAKHHTQRTWYFFNSLYEEYPFEITSNTQHIEVDKDILQQYLSRYNPSGNTDFPLERSADDFPDVLGTYFNLSPTPPDVVVIIVESLGRHLMGEHGEKNIFMPFIDSLAQHGLYWKNCIATGNRSFAALPAVLSSAPLGIHGFQYGHIPQHYSLFSLLRNTNYTTHVFYGGEYSFDSMLDFLSLQHIDNIYNAVPHLKEYRKQKLATYWGLFDHVLFDNSIQQLQKNGTKNPQFSTYVTLTSHDPFSGDNKFIKEEYEEKATQLFSALSQREQNYFQEFYNTNRAAPFVYTDDCIRDFVQNYCKSVNENTIFVIVGDHATTILKNELAGHSVPLIIWSPLLDTTAQFPNITSHAAIAPSLAAFLQHNYSVQLPEKLAWTSKGLDTAQQFNPQEKLLLFTHSKHVTLLLYDQFLYNHETNTLFAIDENLDLQEIKEPQPLHEMSKRFTELRTINNYVYFNNQLSQKNDESKQEFRPILQRKNSNTIVITTPNQEPPKKKAIIMDLIPKQKFTVKHKYLKIQCSMEVLFDKVPIEHNHVRLLIDVQGSKGKYNSDERLIQYILDNNVVANKPYFFTMEKLMDV
ncbi:MAG: LTA synthase family protein, partial [Bacteroidales bacterium]|nr:LTA synthase family protein [Bacteroidales bacterium]